MTKIRLRKYTPEEHQKRICKWEGCNQLAQASSKFLGTEFVIRKNFCWYHMNGYKHYKKKDYCENIDGRLGFKCGWVRKFFSFMLDVDHIDDDHTNDTPGNHQTLCRNCHQYKSNLARHKKNPYHVPHPMTGYLKPYRKAS